MIKFMKQRSIVEVIAYLMEIASSQAVEAEVGDTLSNQLLIERRLEDAGFSKEVGVARTF